MKKKIAFIVQRYGLEVNGGAEYHCRILAEKLKDNYTVEVLTTCAKDYLTWSNEYEIGESYINEVMIKRFPVEHPRNFVKFKAIGRKLKKRKPHQKVLRFLGLLEIYEKITDAATTKQNEEKWINEQGPYVPQLINFLKANNQHYDALIFFTYLYYPTAFGVEVAPQKSILIPTAHDEPPIYLQFFRRFFKLPAAILYNTNSEKLFVNRLFDNGNIYSDIVGVGIDLPKQASYSDVSHIISESNKYIIYIGRIEVSKECDQLINYFLAYKALINNNVKLIFVGQSFMELTENPDVIYTGFVSEEIKLTLLKNAIALVMPSIFESLSLVTLESMACGVPVIANEKCEVLKDHINNSKAGFLYNDPVTFQNVMEIILDPDLDLETLSSNAKRYVKEHYTWQKVIEKFNTAISYITNLNK